LPNLVARMLTKRGSEEMAIKHLEQAYTVATSEEGRHQIRMKLAMMRGKHVAAQLEESRSRFEELSARYPYAPEAFSVLAGARRTRAVDLKSLTEPSPPRSTVPGSP
jgi:hypothetical protein